MRIPRCILACALLCSAFGPPGCKGCEDADVPETPAVAEPERPSAAVAAPPKPSEPVHPVASLPPERLPDEAPQLVVDRLRSARASWARISTGGRWLFVYDKAGALQVFDGARGRLVLEQSLLPEVPCRTNALSPNGRRLLVKRGPYVRLINVFTGDTLRDFEVEHAGRLRCTMSLDGSRVVLVDDGRVRIYDPGKDDALTTLTPPVARAASVYADQSASTLIVLGDADDGSQVATAWGGEGGRRWRRLAGVDARFPLLMSATGAWAAGHEVELKASIWNVWTGKPTRQPYEEIYAFVDHDTRMIAGGRTGRVVSVDMETREEAPVATVTSNAAAVAVSLDGTRIASVGGDPREHRIGMWVVGEPQARFQRQTARVPVRGMAWTSSGLSVRAGAHSVTFDAGSSRVSSGTAAPATDGLGDEFIDGPRWAGRGVVRYAGRDVASVDTLTGDLLWSRRVGARVLDASGTASGGRVAVLADKQVTVFTGKGDVEVTWGGEIKRRTAMTVDPSRDQVLLAGGGRLKSHAMGTGEPRWSLPVPKLKRPRLAAAATGSHIARGSDYRRGGVTSDGRARTIAGDFDIDVRVRSMAVAPDGASVAITDGVDITTWDTTTGKRRATLRLVADGIAVAFGPTSAVFAPNAKPYLRWRRGLDHIDRASPDLPGIWQKHTGQEFPL